MKHWKPVVALAGLAGLSLGLRCDVLPGAPLSARAELGLALQGSRSFEGLLTGLRLPPFRPLSPLQPLGDAARPIVLRIEQSADRGGSPQALADLGVAALIAGEVNRAVDHLEEASRLAPGDASILSDLSAAYLARADRGGEVFPDRMRALSAAIRALDRDPRLPEAACNRALGREGLFLAPRGSAKKICEIGGEKEPVARAPFAETGASSPPSMAVFLRNAAFSGDLAGLRWAVKRSPRAGRDIGEELLSSWAEARLAGRLEDARSSLAAARLVGDALWKISGDALFRDTSSMIRSTKDRKVIGLLAAGIANHKKGIEQYKKSNYGLAGQHLRHAEKALALASCPFEVRTLYALALVEHYEGDFDRERARLSRVEKWAQKASYRGLFAESLWMTGFNASERGDSDTALAAYRRALEAFQGLGDRDGAAGAQIMLAELLDELAASSEAWRYRLAALEQTPGIEDSQRLYQVYTVAAMAAFRESLPGVALELQDAALQHAEGLSALARSQALFWRSRYWLAAGSSIRSLDDIRKARQWIPALPDLSARDRAEGDLLLSEAEAKLGSSPAESIRLLTESLSLASKVRGRSHRFEALTLRARAYRAIGRWSDAEADLESAIRIVESWRSKLSDYALKISYLEGVQRVYDEMILLQAEQGSDAKAALDYLERKRARVLLEQIRNLPLASRNASKLKLNRLSDPRGVEGWCRDLPDDAIFLSYARIGDRLLVWAVDRRGVRAFRLLERASRLDAPARQILRMAAEGRGQSRVVEEASQNLFDLLIRPLSEAIPAGARLVISRDDLLGGIPFSLLLDRRTGRYLIEDHVISSAQSANSYVEGRARFREEGTTRRVLVVGDPAFDRETFPHLPPLPGALSEAGRVASSYGPNADLLTGTAATEEAFVSGLIDSDLVQFSGHAVVDRRSPLYSFLVLAPSRGGDDGVLYAHEIYRLRLDRAKLVVLAGCGSAQGPDSRSEGVESLARAFLAAGVPSVLGALWDIPDDAGEELLFDFHHNLQSGLEPAAALRASQIRFLKQKNNRRSPLIWASFEIIGGTATAKGGKS